MSRYENVLEALEANGFDLENNGYKIIVSDDDTKELTVVKDGKMVADIMLAKMNFGATRSLTIPRKAPGLTVVVEPSTIDNLPGYNEKLENGRGRGRGLMEELLGRDSNDSDDDTKVVIMVHIADTKFYHHLTKSPVSSSILVVAMSYIFPQVNFDILRNVGEQYGFMFIHNPIIPNENSYVICHGSQHVGIADLEYGNVSIDDKTLKDEHLSLFLLSTIDPDAKADAIKLLEAVQFGFIRH